MARDTRVNEHIYETLLARYETANITKRLEDSKSETTFEVIEKARFPARPISPTPLKVMQMGLALSVLLSIGLVVLLEYLDNSFRCIHEAGKVLSKPILGAISRIVTTDDLKNLRRANTFAFLLMLLVIVALLYTGIHFYIN